MCTSIAIAIASCGLVSQLGPSSDVSRKMSELTSPHSGLSMKRMEKMVGMAGTAQGMMKITDSQRIHLFSWTKKPDRYRASRNFRFTAINKNKMVLTTVRKNTGSSNRRTEVAGLRASDRPYVTGEST